MPTSEQQKIVRAEFGRVKGVTSDDARERAAELEDAADSVSTRSRADAMRAKAEQLKEWAADFEAEAEAEQADDNADAKARTEKPASSSSSGGGGSTGAKRSSKGKGRGRRRKLNTGRVGRATKQAAIGEPAGYAASAITSTGSWFWLVVVSTLAAALVYRLVTNADKTEKLGATLSTAIDRAIYPKTAFPERYTGAATSATGSQVRRATGRTKKGQ